MCLLAIISDQPSYGYEMVRKLADQNLELKSEGTIYPVLSRLQQKTLIESYLVESPEGPARKYYRITDHGSQTLQHWQAEWSRFSSAVETVIEAGTHD